MTATSTTPPETGAERAWDDVGLANAIATLRRTMRRAARAGDPTNTLSVAQLELLSSVGEHPNARPGEIARLLHLAPNSVATLVTGLSAEGYIVRSASDTDRRAVALALSESGERVVERWQHLNAEILATALSDLHPAWRHLLRAALPALWELIHAIDTLAVGGESGSGDDD